MQDDTSPSFFDAFKFWLKLGFISFGGPTGQIAIMHDQVVERRRWVSESRFLHALNYCMLLPGPEAQQLAIYIGWLLHGTKGGIVAGTLFVLPSAIILWILSYLYITYGTLPWLAGILYGLKGAVLAIVTVALLRIAKKSLTTPLLWGISAASFVALVLNVPYPWIVAAAAFLGWLGNRSNPPAADDMNATFPRERHLYRIFKVVALGLTIWWTPIVLLGLLFGTDHIFWKMGVFFSKAAMITFGGAYAVLPYVAQEAVHRFAWLSPGEMLDGLALAETTPGPLIMVLQFVGFVGTWHHPGGLTPLVSATIGAFITTWVTFVPCFLWIFLGAPYREGLKKNMAVSAALSGVTAAVVGVILNLTLWFAMQHLWQGGSVDLIAAAITALSFIALKVYEMKVTTLVLFTGVIGLFKGMWL